MTKSVVFNVGMTCGGCKGAVERILGKIEGVKSVAADVETKKVVVLTEDTVADEVMIEALKKWSSASNKSVEYVSTTPVKDEEGGGTEGSAAAAVTEEV